MARKKSHRQEDDEESYGQSGEESHPQPKLPQYNLELHWSHEENRLPLRVARDMYLKEYNFERIYLAVAVPPSVFLSRRKRWDKIKEKVDTKIIEDIRKKAVSEQTKEFVEKGLRVGLKFVDRLLKREEEIDPKSWKLISDSIMALHRIHQLELGKPTDISMYENMTPEQTMAFLRETQKQLGEKHEMSMFSPREDIPEEELLAEYKKHGGNSGVH